MVLQGIHRERVPREGPHPSRPHVCGPPQRSGPTVDTIVAPRDSWGSLRPPEVE